MSNVLIETSFGNIEIELNTDKAPVTVQNFLSYVNDEFYNETIFHRVIPNFMIQGGGFLSDMMQKPTKDPIKIEADNGLQNTRGSIAMARTNDPNSATSQFFINHRDNAFLNHSGPTPEGWGYTVFGAVTSGIDVVDKIASVSTGNSGGHADVPIEPVVITKIAEI